MSSVFEYGNPARCIVGTVGLPGERAFYLQVTEGVRVTTIAIEKTQAAALTERMREIVRNIARQKKIPLASTQRDDEPLQSPFDVDFRAGDMSILYLNDEAKLQIEIQEFNEQRVNESDDVEVPREGNDLAMVRIQLSVSQSSEFVRRAEAVIQSGRQPCMFCGLPINPEGHLCPRANGYRR